MTANTFVGLLFFVVAVVGFLSIVAGALLTWAMPETFGPVKDFLREHSTKTIAVASVLSGLFSYLLL